MSTCTHLFLSLQVEVVTGQEAWHNLVWQGGPSLQKPCFWVAEGSEAPGSPSSGLPDMGRLRCQQVPAIPCQAPVIPSSFSDLRPSTGAGRGGRRMGPLVKVSPIPALSLIYLIRCVGHERSCSVLPSRWYPAHLVNLPDNSVHVSLPWSSPSLQMWLTVSPCSRKRCQDPCLSPSMCPACNFNY